MAGLEDWAKIAATRAAKSAAAAPPHWITRDANAAIAAAKTPAEAESAWRQYLGKALTDFTVEGRNLAPNAPYIHFVPAGGGKPIKVPNTPQNITKVIEDGGSILNKTEAEIRQLMPKLPTAETSTTAAIAPFLGAAGATGVLPFTGLPGQGSGSVPPVPPELATGTYGTEGASPASQTAVQTAREVLQPQQTPAAAPAPAAAPTVNPNEPQRSLTRSEHILSDPYYGMDGGESSPTYGTQQYQPNEPRRFPTVARAVEMSKGRGSSPQMGTTQTSPTAAAASDVLQSIIRGRFGEAGKGSPMDDRLTAFQEARDQSGDSRKSGGAVGGKDQAIHKALEIIHHLISRR